MPARRMNGPMRLKATVPGRDTPHDGLPPSWASRRNNNPGARPSEDFNWDKALTLHAQAMRDLGYTLSDDQKKRIT